MHRGIAMALLRRRSSAQQRAAVFQGSISWRLIAEQQHCKHDAHHRRRRDRNPTRAVEKPVVLPRMSILRGTGFVAKPSGRSVSKRKAREFSSACSLGLLTGVRTFADTATSAPKTAMVPTPVC
jgi:hypothetical protein